MDKTELNKQTAIRFVEAMGANDPQTAGARSPLGSRLRAAQLHVQQHSRYLAFR